MHAYRIQRKVTEDRQVTLKLPPDFPVGAAEIIVLAEEQEVEQVLQREAMQEFLRRLAASPGSGRTKEEIDRYIAEERATWDR